ncbi:MAG TPA: hypothetical protein VGK73_25005, partial [Polyangiaceae bacterium]
APAPSRVTVPAAGASAGGAAGTAALGAAAPGTGVGACSTRPSAYWVRIEGDGAPYTLRAGAARPPLPLRDCEPASIESAPAPFVSACSDAADVRRACLWASRKRAVYYDRTGTFWELEVQQYSANRAADALDGSATFLASSRARPEKLTLRVSFHVGTSVPSVPAPNIWGPAREFAEL